LDPDVIYGLGSNNNYYVGTNAFVNNAGGAELITVSNVNSDMMSGRTGVFEQKFGNQVKHVTLLDSVTDIYGYMFSSSALESINLNKVQTVGYGAFLNTQLTQVILPSDALIGFGAFNDAFETGVVRVDAVLGCTDATAFNYDTTANTDDGSCVAVVNGCTDATAFNYAPAANTDDGSCVAVVNGCTDTTATNYDASANTDDGSCAAAPPAPPAADPAPTGGCEAGLTATEYQSRGCCEC
jgi:hypothetical protein